MQVIDICKLCKRNVKIRAKGMCVTCCSYDRRRLLNGEPKRKRHIVAKQERKLFGRLLKKEDIDENQIIETELDCEEISVKNGKKLLLTIDGKEWI